MSLKIDQVDKGSVISLSEEDKKYSAQINTAAKTALTVIGLLTCFYGTALFGYLSAGGQDPACLWYQLAAASVGVVAGVTAQVNNETSAERAVTGNAVASAEAKARDSAPATRAAFIGSIGFTVSVIGLIGMDLIGARRIADLTRTVVIPVFRILGFGGIIGAIAQSVKRL